MDPHPASETDPRDPHENFLRLWTRHEPELRAYVHACLPRPSDVDEVMQNVSLVAWRKYSSVENDAHFPRWACLIAKYEILMARRRHARNRLVLDEDIAEKLDPPGFALEPFDVIGGLRTFYRMPKSTGQLMTLHRFGGRRVHRGPAIETGYTMPDGRSFQDINEYRTLLLEDEDTIAAAFTSKLLTYATGAPLQFADRDDLKQILEKTRPERFGLRSLIHAIVQSRPFLQK
jgi:hypothetical protein